MRAPALQALGPRRGRVAVPLVLAGLVAAGWAGTLRLGAAMEGHAAHHAGLVALFAMWAAMAVAMMVPVEAASLLRLARGLRDTGTFLAGYLLPWLAFSLGAAGLQQRLQAAGWMDAGVATSNRWLAAALLFAAGLAQLSPLRQACLSRCRAASLTATGAGGLLGGFRASVSSIGCCGLLMLVPFATGVMSISWMAALTVLLVVEREVPRASRLGTVAGILLVVLGAWRSVAAG
jgi:predicted metal-binding membrane protein